MEKISDQCYLGYIDLLGFGNFVLDNSFKTVQGRYKKIVDNTNILLSREPFFYNKDGKKFAKGDPSNLAPNCILFSDSIILWTNDLKPASFRKLLFDILNFILHHISTNFPVRCSIAIGDIDVKYIKGKGEFVNIQTQIIGNGLVKAVKLEKKQNWSGCIIERDAILYYNKSVEHAPHSNATNMQFLTKKPIIIEYPVPILKDC